MKNYIKEYNKIKVSYLKEYPHIALIPVTSSAVSAIGYDKDQRILIVRFNSGNTGYVYVNVPETVFKEFMQCESKGKYLNKVIKPNYSVNS
jgi:hypothetical protein